MTNVRETNARKIAATTARQGGKVVPLRDSALYRPLPRKGVTLTFGLDEVAGQLVIRYSDGTFERLGVSLDDLKT